MALWQNTFFILPSESIVNSESFRLDEDNCFDDSVFWGKMKIDSSVFDNIELLLPKAKSWSNDLSIYGNENSHRLDVLCEKEHVVSVSFRIDFTSDYEYILRGIIEFCILKAFIILNEHLNIVPLNFEAIKNIIDNSLQVKKYDDLV